MTDDLTLRMERRFPTPVERIFTAWTDPALLCQWFWPERINPSYDVDLRVGGRFRISSDVVTVSGEYLEIDAPNRLVYTWQWQGEQTQTQVVVEFRTADRAAGTELVLLHEHHDTAEQRDNHRAGWTDCLDRLESRLGS